MNFIFSFSQTEESSGNYGYMADFLVIYDGPNDQSTQIEKLSGNLGSFSISSTGNSLFLIFIPYNIGYNNIHGFHATIHYGNPYLNIK